MKSVSTLKKIIARQVLATNLHLPGVADKRKQLTRQIFDGSFSLNGFSDGYWWLYIPLRNTRNEFICLTMHYAGGRPKFSAPFITQ